MFGLMSVTGLIASRSASNPAANAATDKTQIHATQPGSAIPESPQLLPTPATTSTGASAPASVEPQINSNLTPSFDTYQTISARNIFGLQPIPPPAPQLSAPTAPPKDDLQLTGLFDLGSVRMALFRTAGPGQSPACFTLGEGDQNEWLEVLSIDGAQQTVKVRLKQPVVRIRSVGVEVLLTLPAQH